MPPKKRAFTPTTQDVQRFLGPWIGETIGAPDREAHLWTISEAWGGVHKLSIRTNWEAVASTSDETYVCELQTFDGRPSFIVQDLGVAQPFGIAILLDSSHFIVPFWDDELNVIFSRPGVAELTAHGVCRAYCDTAAYTTLKRRRLAALRSSTRQQA